MSDVRVRIAPSPSGFLHVGVARTAIFNWLFARSQGGKFILRIEDTDAARSSDEMVDSILKSFTWLGLDWDEEPIFQSTRLDIHQKYMNKLLDSGKAYRCFCTPEELNEKREEARNTKADYKYDRTCLNLNEDDIKQKLDNSQEYVLRLKIPEGETRFDDLIYGEMKRQNKDIEDFVICRRDGRPLYNFVVVVDDHEMGITHIFRGNDHQTNTFKQVLIYEALDLPVPKLGHLPLIFDHSKKKISKRDKAANASDYGNQGYLPEAVFNYLCLLGWSPKDDREIFTVEELVEIFDVNNANKSNAVFDEVKLKYVNGEHIRRKSNHELATMIAPLLVQADLSTKYGLETRWRYLMDVVEQLKERCQLITDFVEQADYFFQPPIKYDEKGVSKNFSPQTAKWLETLAERYNSLKEFTKPELEATLKNYAEELGVGGGKLIHPTRLAVTGTTKGPGLYDILEMVGKMEVVERMRKAANYIRENIKDE